MSKYKQYQQTDHRAALGWSKELGEGSSCTQYQARKRNRNLSATEPEHDKGNRSKRRKTCWASEGSLALLPSETYSCFLAVIRNLSTTQKFCLCNKQMTGEPGIYESWEELFRLSGKYDFDSLEQQQISQTRWEHRMDAFLIRTKASEEPFLSALHLENISNERISGAVGSADPAPLLGILSKSITQTTVQVSRIHWPT